MWTGRWGRKQFASDTRRLGLTLAVSPGIVGLLAAALLGLVAIHSSCNSSSERTAPAKNEQAPPITASQEKSLISRPDIGFASYQKLVEHYQKHGREFGPISIDEYLRRAQELRDRPGGGNVLESVRPDGVTSRFDRSTGAFIAFNRDGVVRTFFRPNYGEAYFRRQSRRKN
jgi:pyocin large subunit-like protein